MYIYKTTPVLEPQIVMSMCICMYGWMCVLEFVANGDTLFVNEFMVKQLNGLCGTSTILLPIQLLYIHCMFCWNKTEEAKYRNTSVRFRGLNYQKRVSLVGSIVARRWVGVVLCEFYVQSWPTEIHSEFFGGVGRFWEFFK